MMTLHQLPPHHKPMMTLHQLRPPPHVHNHSILYELGLQFPGGPIPKEGDLSLREMSQVLGHELVPLRLLDTYASKIAKICVFWTFWAVIQLMVY